jgi:methionyl-tRNA synthetase
MSTQRFLITSALPYINGVKHLGNLAGSMLPADAFARHLRARGDSEVKFICATDEHGTPAELAAQAAGQSVETYCGEQHAIQADLADRFGLSFDHFGRSSSKTNHRLTRRFYEALSANGMIEKRTIKQYFSIDDDLFLPDRYILGTCPKCSFGMARGDQCDQCGSLLDPTDLINPQSAISCSTNLELRETDHLFLCLSKAAPDVTKWLLERDAHWSTLARGIAHKHINEGLQDRCITRDLKWGIPVPDMPGKVFYVWFDAPIAYYAATIESCHTESEVFEAQFGQSARTSYIKSQHVRAWLSADTSDLTYVQVMGKDNVAFHTTSFPATVLGAKNDLPFDDLSNMKTVDYLKAFNWLNWNGGKFSTSGNRGIFMDAALELFPADYWRWYLLSNAPESNDTAFTWSGFQKAVNSDLADKLGNFINRVVSMCQKYDLMVIESDRPLMEGPYIGPFGEIVAQQQRAMSDFEIVKAATLLRDMAQYANTFLQNAAPWKLHSAGDLEGTKQVLRQCIYFACELGRFFEPFIPFTSEKIKNAFDTPVGGPWVVNPPGILFDKISDDRIAELEAQYP